MENVTKGSYVLPTIDTVILTLGVKEAFVSWPGNLTPNCKLVSIGKCVLNSK